MAIGSRRTTPTWPTAAAVVSEPMVAPMKTPWVQSKDCRTSGTVSLRRPPKMIAEIGTPCGTDARGESAGVLAMGVVERLRGWSAFSPDSGVQRVPFQSYQPPGGSLVIPSHQTSPSAVSATLVKIVSLRSDAMALGLLFSLVPGATPK